MTIWAHRRFPAGSLFFHNQKWKTKMANEEKLGKILFASNETFEVKLPRYMAVQWAGVKKLYTLDLKAFTPSLLAYGFAHGTKQKAGDQFGTEKARTPEARAKIIEDTLAQLLLGDWNKKRGVTEEKAPKLPETFEAFLCTREGLTSDAHTWIKSHPARKLSTTNAEHVIGVVKALAKSSTFAEKVKHLRGVYNSKIKASTAIETLDLDLDLDLDVDV